MNYRDMLIDEKETILHAMKTIDKNSGRLLFVTHENVLIGAISDGDIRRWLMKGGSLDTPLIKAANTNPKFIYASERDKAKQVMDQNQITALPVVDEYMHVVDIICLLVKESDSSTDELSNVPVVIMAGGLGTRLYPYTKILPKPLIPVGDIPITEHIINRFRMFGCKDFYLVVNHKKNMIKAYYSEIEKDYNIYFVDEDKPLGTGGGVGLLKGRINTTFILTNCDTLIEENYPHIIEEHKKRQNKVTMICSLKNFEIPYGVVEIGENGSIAAIQEKPHYSFFTNTGIYIVEPEIIENIMLDEVIGFPDVIQKAKDAGQNVGVYPINEKSWLDMGQFDSMEDMRKRLGV